MTDLTLSEALAAAARTALDRREAGRELELTADDLKLERPRNREHGDWASNIAMRFAKRVGSNPREFAQEIAAALESNPAVKSVAVAGPGFINITLDEAAAGALAAEIVEAGAGYGTRSTSNLFRPTQPAPSTSGVPAGPRWETRWLA